MTAMDGGNASNAGAITCPCHDAKTAFPPLWPWMAGMDEMQE
jgi:hypothetical protein